MSREQTEYAKMERKIFLFQFSNGCQKRNIFPNSKGVNFACQKGRVKIVQWCFERGILPMRKALIMPMDKEIPKMLKWITTKRFIPGIKSIHCICERGDLYLLEKISENVLPNRISANEACSIWTCKCSPMVI